MAVLAVLMGVTGGAAGGTGTSDQALPVLRIGVPTSSDPNPAKYPGEAVAASTFMLSYEPVLVQKANGSFTPGLATSWRYVKAGRGRNKDFEFTLRRNARFSDGTPVTAAAYVRWFRYWLSTTFDNIAASLGPNPRVEAVSRWKVQLHFTVPNPGIPTLLSQFPLSMGWLASAKAIANPSLFATGQSFGAGPYMLDRSRTVIGDHYTYVPNRYYYNKAAIKWSRIEVKVIANPSSMLQALRAGQLDVAYGDITTRSAASGAGYTITSAPVGYVGFWLFGMTSGALKDVRVRQALNYAINRSAISRTLLGGTPTSSMLTTDGNVPANINRYPYNPQRARTLLAAAGHANGLTLSAMSAAYAGVLGDPVVQAVARDLAAVGVDLKITPVNNLGELVQGILSGKFDMGEIPQFPVYSTGQTFQFFFVPKTGFVSATNGLDDLTLAKLFYTAIKSSKPTQYWRQMMERITNQAYVLTLGTTPELWYTKNVRGIRISLRAPAAYIADWSRK